jgi:hypothetical protein
MDTLVLLGLILALLSVFAVDISQKRRKYPAKDK